MNNLDAIEELLAGLRLCTNDKPASHKLAKDLVKAAQALVHSTQAGAGEFKWSAKMVKKLTRPATGRNSSPKLIIARDQDTGVTYYTDGHYIVKGEPSQRMKPYEEQEIPYRQVMSVIDGALGGKVVTISEDAPPADLPNSIMLSNGAYVDITLIAYVLSFGVDPIMTSKGKLCPIVVYSNGEVIGLVMPLNHEALTRKKA